MGYKSILTIASNVASMSTALDHATAIAQHNTGHLDVMCLGVDAVQAGYYYGGANALLQQDSLDRAVEHAAEIEALTKLQLDGLHIGWNCFPLVAQIAGVTNAVARHARFADLVVLPKPYAKNHDPEDETIVEAALFEGHTPVLVVPGNAAVSLPSQKVVIAWNQSAEALAAIRAALPVLKTADIVNIAIIDPPEHGFDRSDPGGALSQMLARHGVRAEISVLAKTLPNVADVLTRHIRDLDAKLLVMGAYGHSRFRESILGGATHDMLQQAEVPVLMAH